MCTWCVRDVYVMSHILTTTKRISFTVVPHMWCYSLQHTATLITQQRHGRKWTFNTRLPQTKQTKTSLCLKHTDTHETKRERRGRARRGSFWVNWASHYSQETTERREDTRSHREDMNQPTTSHQPRCGFVTNVKVWNWTSPVVMFTARHEQTKVVGSVSEAH